MKFLETQTKILGYTVFSTLEDCEHFTKTNKQFHAEIPTGVDAIAINMDNDDGYMLLLAFKKKKLSIPLMIHETTHMSDFISRKLVVEPTVEETTELRARIQEELMTSLLKAYKKYVKA